MHVCMYVRSKAKPSDSDFFFNISHLLLARGSAGGGSSAPLRVFAALAYPPAVPAGPETLAIAAALPVGTVFLYICK